MQHFDTCCGPQHSNCGLVNTPCKEVCHVILSTLFSPEDTATRQCLIQDQENCFQGESTIYDLRQDPSLAHNPLVFQGTRTLGEDIHEFTRDCLLRVTDQLVHDIDDADPPRYS